MTETSPTTPDPQQPAAPGAEGVQPGASATGGSPEGTVDAAALTLELAAAREEAAKLREQYVRVLADLDNQRKRGVRDRDEARQAALARAIEEFVPVHDALSAGLVAARSGGDVSKGIEMVLAQFRAALERNGVAEVNPPPGTAFDPNVHESIGEQPSADVPAGAVLLVVRTGFRTPQRLIRAATVILSSGAPVHPAAS